MDRDSWDRLSPGERDALILNATASRDFHYSFHDDQLWLSLRGGPESSSDVIPTSNLNQCHGFVEREIRHRGLGDKYLRELCRMLIGISPNTIQFEDLWSLITATPSERCLAALNTLEGSK